MDASMDLTKLKVADLKKELKIRGLATTGKRNELLDRLQAALAAGVGLEDGAEDDEEFDEDEILAGDDADDDDSKMTPMEEAAALATAEKVTATATPGRGRRAAAVAAAATPSTPRTTQRKLALRRTDAASLVVPEDATPVTAAVTPKSATPVKASPSKKTIAPIEALEDEPPAKISKTEDANKENGEADKPKTALELRSARFGIVSDDSAKSKRGERFGVVDDNAKKTKRMERFAAKAANKLSTDVGTVDVEKLKLRAARFGETVAKSLTTEEADKKKQARGDRFKTAEEPKKDVTSDEVKAARAAKFGDNKTKEEDAVDEPVFSKSGKKLITMSADDAVLQKRAAKFATTA